MNIDAEFSPCLFRKVKLQLLAGEGEERDVCLCEGGRGAAAAEKKDQRATYIHRVPSDVRDSHFSSLLMLAHLCRLSVLGMKFAPFIDCGRKR